jgi:hypothetical protein
MYDHLGHRGRLGEIQIADQLFTVTRDEVSGAVIREFAQHLITNGRNAVGLFGRGDQLADPALLIVGEGCAPVDRVSH